VSFWSKLYGVVRLNAECDPY